MYRAVCAAVLTLLLVGCEAGPVEVGDEAPQFTVVSGDQQTGQYERELAEPLVVLVQDEKGKALKDHLVNFVVTEGGGSVFAGSAVTNSEGIAYEWWMLGAPGPQTIEVRATDRETGAKVVYETFTATAEPTRTFRIEGVVFSAPEPLTDFTGETLAITYTFDVTTSDDDPGDPSRGEYDALTSLRIDVGDAFTCTVSSDDWFGGLVLVGDQGPGGTDQLGVRLLALNRTACPTVAGWQLFAQIPAIQVLVTLTDADGTVLSTDALPTSPPELSEFETRALRLSFVDPTTCNPVCTSIGTVQATASVFVEVGMEN